MSFHAFGLFASDLNMLSVGFPLAPTTEKSRMEDLEWMLHKFNISDVRNIIIKMDHHLKKIKQVVGISDSYMEVKLNKDGARQEDVDTDAS